jgi:hypothetical protein
MTGSAGARLVVGLLAAGAAVSAAPQRLTGAAAPGDVSRMTTLAEVRPILAALGDRAPEDLRTAGSGEARWSAWLKERDLDIRRRLAAGDEDSVVNLMLYGTGFTRQPRATPTAIAASGRAARLEDVMDGRLSDLVAAIEAPGLPGMPATNERLQFVRDVVGRHGITVGAPSRGATERYLIDLRSRVLSENERYMRRIAAVPLAAPSEQRGLQATLYRDRGLSSDTSLRVDFALEQTLAALRDRGELAGGPVERVAVVGPGLDFVDKAQGYDFYPVQMIQPFALAESLRRLGMADRPALTTFDISPRVLGHLRDARQRATRRQPYRVNLVIEQETSGSRLEPALVEYWRRFGDRIGTSTATEVPAAYASQVRARAVDLRPEVVLDVTGVELNIVLERIADARPARQFDLLVATNVLIYYDAPEQALAVGNMASMLRDGGLLMTNQPVPVSSTCGLSPVLIMSVDFDRVQSDGRARERGDSIHVYRKGRALQPPSPLAANLRRGNAHDRP